ncbi:MAG: LysR family transcriptional regulator [Nakamurella multipartita]
MIDVRKLEILRELDRCGTIAATAAAVHLTPSAVSQQLAALSKEAGTAMLEPDGRRVRLTEAAQLLLQHAHQIFTHLEHAESDLAAFRRGDAGTVRVGTFSSAVKALAVPLVSDLSTRTRIRVELREVQPEDALDALLGRRVDICLNLATTELLPGSDDKRVHSEHLLDDVMDVALPFDHPLADRRRDRAGRFVDEDWICSQPRGAVLAARPGRLRTGQVLARPPLRRRIRQRGQRDRGRPPGVSLLPQLAQPEGRARTDRAATRRRGQPGSPDQRADPGRHRRPAAHRARPGVPAPGRRRRWPGPADLSQRDPGRRSRSAPALVS